ncbi:MAG: MFS transporter, partial [Actinomycetota bacterium]|nr:MFS transporter [Actinomycetota bacterium]
GAGRYEAAEGPFTEYRRQVEVTAEGDERYTVRQTVDFRLAVPYCGWLFLLPVKRALSRPPADSPPWWAPPARLDAQAASALGCLCMLGLVFGYLNTLFNQTIAFAGEEFGAGNAAQGLAGAVVRSGGVVALAVAVVADRRGRRFVLLWAATAGCILATGGAVAPSLPWLTASQMAARAFATALAIVVAIMAVEEMPARSRAYALSVLAMASGLGAGVCLWALPLADLGERGWRLLYVVPLVALPLLRNIGRRLPETRRFRTPHADAPLGRHGRRLLLLAASGALVNLFVAPQAQFHNRFLRVERGFSGGGISLLSLSVGTFAGVGVVAGGRLADVKGRRRVAAVALVFGTLLTTAFYFADGWALWAWGMAGTLVFDASIPALGVYGPELFPTSLRGRANGIVTIAALGGSALGLLAAGQLADGFGRIGPAMLVLAVGPVLLALLVLTLYPETAGRELEDINPEDRSPPTA